MTMSICICLYYFLVCIVFVSAGEYYWKDFSGIFPTDAFIAGNDTRGNVYIGQNSVKQNGIEIIELVNDVYNDQVPNLSKQKNIIGSKILAGPSEEYMFEWIEVDGSNAKMKMLEHSLVIAGLYMQMPIGVCRKQINDKIHLGKVLEFNKKHVHCYLHNRGSHKMDNFELLTITKTQSPSLLSKLTQFAKNMLG